MLEWVVSSAVLTALVIALRFILKGKISLRLQYALWALVLLRLLVPVSFGATGLSVGNLTQKVAETEAVKMVSTLSQMELPRMTYSAAYSEVAKEYAEKGIDIAEMPVDAFETVDYEILSRMGGQWSIRDVLKAVWIFGIAAVGFVLIVSNIRFSVKLRKSRYRLDGKSYPLPVYVSPDVETPCLFGLFHPAIYLTPEAAADGTILRHTVEHEVTHFRHGDHIWSLLRGACLAIHWFNPPVWWAAVLSRNDSELACDEATIKRIGENERAEYGRTLIGMTYQKRPALLLTATTMTGSKSSIKERIMLIAKKPKTAIYTLVVVLLIAAVAVGCTFTGAKGNNADLAPDTVAMSQPLSSAFPPDAITDAGTVEYLWNLYQGFTFDGTAETIDKENVWSIAVTFSNSATGKSESFTIHQGGLCVLGGDYETYHILVNGAELYDAFLRCFEEAKSGRTGISIELDNSIPDAVIDYAIDYTEIQLLYYTDEVGYEITEAKITGLTPIDLSIPGADTTVGLWLLEYRFLAADPDKVMLVGGMQMDGDYITEWGSTGQPYLLLNRTADTTYERICVTNTLTMQEKYATPEMLERYGDMYTAAAMELASAAGIAFHPATQTDESERLRLATVDGFSHMPLDELSQEVLDSLTLVNEGDFDGFYPSEWGYCRTYTAPGLEIMTTAPSAAYLDMLAEQDKDNLEQYPTEADFWSYIEGEEGREWIVHVLITDDKYATLDGLKVGMTIGEAENLGYALSAGKNNIGTVSVELSVVVENDAVVQMETWWTMGRYIGKFFEL